MQQPTPPVATDQAPTTEHTSEGRVMELLHEHVPLSLLVDLAERRGLDSRDILDTEGEPTEPWWENTTS